MRSYGGVTIPREAVQFDCGVGVIISKGLSRVGTAGLLLALSLAVSAREQVTQTSADIRRTSYGVPHIRASDERGLGVGMGYAYAQDNLCLLAEEFATVAGERSRRAFSATAGVARW